MTKTSAAPSLRAAQAGSSCLTHAAVLALAPQARRFVAWDSDLKGFGVRVEASGRKFFLVRYRAHGGGRRAPLRQMCLGAVGALSCAAARKQAEGVLALVRLGGDPAQERMAQRSDPTIADLIAFYLDHYAPSAGLRATTLRDARSVLNRYVLPRWRTKRVCEIAVADARVLHAAILDQGGVSQANRALALLSSAFTRAIESGWRTDNPFRLVRKSPQDPRTRILSEDEIGRLLQALDRHPDQSAANAVRLLLMTGSRLNEVLKARWTQFDLASGLWIKPSAHTKQRRTHRLSLTADALHILRKMRAGDPGGVFLFPGVSPEAPRVDLKRPWAWVRNEAGLSDVRLHDLRRTLGSYMAMDGHSAALVGSALGHTQAATTARYMAIGLEAQRNALEITGRRFSALGAQKMLLSY